MAGLRNVEKLATTPRHDRGLPAGTPLIRFGLDGVDTDRWRPDARAYLKAPTSGSGHYDVNYFVDALKELSAKPEPEFLAGYRYPPTYVTEGELQRRASGMHIDVLSILIELAIARAAGGPRHAVAFLDPQQMWYHAKALMVTRQWGMQVICTVHAGEKFSPGFASASSIRMVSAGETEDWCKDLVTVPRLEDVLATDMLARYTGVAGGMDLVTVKSLFDVLDGTRADPQSGDITLPRLILATNPSQIRLVEGDEVADPTREQVALVLRAGRPLRDGEASFYLRHLQAALQAHALELLVDQNGLRHLLLPKPDDATLRSLEAVVRAQRSFAKRANEAAGTLSTHSSRRRTSPRRDPHLWKQVGRQGSTATPE